MLCPALAGVAKWIEHRPVKQSVTQFYSQSGHKPGFGLGSHPSWGMSERQPHIDVFLLLFLPPFPFV